MNEQIRMAIMREVCKAFVASTYNDSEEVQTSLLKIMDLLRQPETLEHAVTTHLKKMYQNGSTL